MPATKTKKKRAVKKMCVRINPPNRSRGYYAETFTLSGSGYPKFDWRRGWYTVDLRTAAILRKQVNNPNDPYSKPVFEVCTPEEAKALDRIARRQKATADDPVPMPPGVDSRHEPDREDVRKTAESFDDDDLEDDENTDLRDDLDDDDWGDDLSPDLEEPEEGVEIADDEDDDLDDLVAPPPAKKKVAKKKVTKRTTKKKASTKKKATKKKATKKPRRKTSRG